MVEERRGICVVPTQTETRTHERQMKTDPIRGLTSREKSRKVESSLQWRSSLQKV